jgi:hypothetical protein
VKEGRKSISAAERIVKLKYKVTELSSDAIYALLCWFVTRNV